MSETREYVIRRADGRRHSETGHVVLAPAAWIAYAPGMGHRSADSADEAERLLVADRASCSAEVYRFAWDAGRAREGDVIYPAGTPTPRALAEAAELRRTLYTAWEAWKAGRT